MIELTLDMAERAAKAALAKAKQLGTVMTASVVDESGRSVLMMRGDGAGFFSPETSRKKAVAAANFRKTTKELGEQAAKGSPFWAAVPAALAGEILPSIGAVPITKGGRVIGAIGCGGGTGEQDHECAQAGAAAVNAQLGTLQCAFDVSAPAMMDAGLQQALAEGANALGIEAPALASGAGHDAQDLAHAGFRAGMIFVRNAHGSHNPHEAMAIDDFCLGTQTLAWMLAR